MMSERITLLVVDDNAMLRTGLRYTIQAELDIQIVGEASNGSEARDRFRELRPDVVSMDYRMPKEDGVTACRKIVDEFPEAKVLLLSICEGEEDIWNAWNAGAKGYLPKDDAVGQIAAAIRSLAAGQHYFPPGIADKLELRKGQSSLTPREMEVLQLIVRGCSNKEIMEALTLSSGTVRMHVSNMIDKLGVADRTQAAIAAVKRGIVHLD
ncbi:response regulator [Luteolibacter algae]|uniref:Response regulator n=1 Tax=Luteolibacter algae TaxID=454151 RepID=A0ABW5D6H6_9BACT